MASDLFTYSRMMELAKELILTLEPRGDEYIIKWINRTLFSGPLDRCGDFLRGYATAKGLLF